MRVLRYVFLLSRSDTRSAFIPKAFTFNDDRVFDAQVFIGFCRSQVHGNIELAWRGSGPCGRHGPGTRNALKYGNFVCGSQVDEEAFVW